MTCERCEELRRELADARADIKRLLRTIGCDRSFTANDVTQNDVDAIQNDIDDLADECGGWEFVETRKIIVTCWNHLAAKGATA